MSRNYVDLSNTDSKARWERLILKAKKHLGTGFYTEYEEEFVQDMVAKTEDARIWNPSLKQYNFLHTLVN